MKYPVLQVALDFVDLKRALRVAAEAVKGGCDWIEAGTPLIKSEGLQCVRALRKMFPKKIIVADMKVMDAGRTEVEAAAKAGADVVCVLGAATDATIKECVEAGRNYGARIEADLIGVGNPVSRAKQLEALGVDYIGVHCPIDEQMAGRNPFDTLARVSGAVRIPVAAAGGISSETASDSVKAGACVIIVGGAITKSADARKSAAAVKKAMQKKIRIKSEYYVRVNKDNVRNALARVSNANISDAMHRSGSIDGLKAVWDGAKMAGPAVTVRTYPGDWAKTVEACDVAGPGDVIVIDAGGVGPAIWGELATHGALQKGIAGLVVDGAVRDVKEIKKLKFPVFSRLVTPRAGEPKGFGEIGVPVTIAGVRVMPGDWIVGDADGLCRIPADRVVEVANRAMSVLETENRVRKEIDGGSTLAQVMELVKWEKEK
ncbi:MAG: 3-hexulose-6-phosphate synthase [Candidatus Omnitrophota bacterium]